MSTADSCPEVVTNFDNSEIDSRLSWHVATRDAHRPLEVKCCADGKSGLLVRSHEKTDFWQRTYYDPPLTNVNGHLLALPVTCPPKVVVEAKLTLTVKSQFDQAGVMVYIDDHHWLKTGLEFSDGQIYLGCVVTNEYSDWSTQDWASNELTIRLYVLPNDSCVVEAQASDGSWKMIRLAHLQMTGTSQVKVGIYTAAPTTAGGSVVFHSLSIKPTEGYHHHA